MTIEEREDLFLEEQIQDLKKEERKEKRYLKKIDFIINILNNKNYEFKINFNYSYDEEYQNLIDENFNIYYKKKKSQHYKYFYYYDCEGFFYMNKEYKDKLLKYIEDNKIEIINNDETEF